MIPRYIFSSSCWSFPKTNNKRKQSEKKKKVSAAAQHATHKISTVDFFCLLYFRRSISSRLILHFSVQETTRILASSCVSRFSFLSPCGRGFLISLSLFLFFYKHTEETELTERKILDAKDLVEYVRIQLVLKCPPIYSLPFNQSSSIFGSAL